MLGFPCFSTLRPRARAIAYALGVGLLALAPAASGRSNQDLTLRFSTPGPDRYADGSIVADGECYALVWSPAGRAFGGFHADGSAAAPGDRVVLAGAVARDGHCPEALFQVDAAEASALEGGTWALCLIDTRNARGVPTGVDADGRPRRVNRWSVVKNGVSVAPASATTVRKTLRAAPTQDVGEADAGFVAGTRSSVPASTPRPRIAGLEIEDGTVRLSVEDTVPYLTYGVASGESLDALADDKGASVEDGSADRPIELEAEASGDSRFFRIIRAE